MCLIVESITDGLKDTIRELDEKWKMYVSLHLKRCRLENEAEKLSAATGEAKGLGESGEIDERRSRIRSLSEEA
jgi:hypothetical protein